jgi:crotonobetainyl-CoA:carnitine CoA-transferase CaiB-like acyl-CoA transferase
VTGSSLPLAGVTVLDMSRLFPGSYATLLLASLGAEVIKVEDVAGGDGMRQMMVFPPQSESAGHLALNRGKKSLAIDLKSPDGQRMILELVAQADVLIDSFRPGVLDRLGMGADALAAANESLVHVSITAFGATGPYTKRPAHDLNSVGYAGLVGLVADADGNLALPGLQNADLAAGMHAALAALAGLRAAERDGAGYRADVAMSEAAASLLSLQLATVAGTGQSPPVPDFLTGQLACYGVYECGDGEWLTVAGLEPKFFGRMVELMGRPELAAAQFDPAGQPQLRDSLAQDFRTRPRSEWLELLAGEDTCVGPVLSLTQALAEDHFAARGTVAQARFRDGRPARFFRATPWEARADNDLQAPDLGEHTAELLAEIGVTPDQLAALVASGIVRAPS